MEKKIYKLNENIRVQQLVGKRAAPVNGIVREVKKISVEVRCMASDDKRCNDKHEPNALCFGISRPCDCLEFVKVESEKVIICE